MLIPEPDETFTITLTNATTGATISDATAVGRITNDDGSGLSIADVSLAEGAQDATPTMTFTVSVIPPSIAPITFNWTTMDDSTTNAAEAGSDYTANSGTDIVIPANAATYDINCSI